MGLIDTVLLIVGVVVGAGIFALPSLVAANTGTTTSYFLAWVAGGVVSLAGALCYAELATTYPHSGGEHHILRRALGQSVGFFFAWARLAVLQTGSIAIQAYIVGDYVARWLPGAATSPLVAALTVIAITSVNLFGFRQGKWAQLLLGGATCIGLLAVAATGLLAAPAEPALDPVAAAAGTETSPAFGLALVFVLLAFGGWNEAAYVSADVSRRNMVRALIWGIATITTIYLLVNFAYVRGLGLPGVAASSAVAADLVERALGPELAFLTSAAIVVAALSTMNATTITGGRSNCALGETMPLFRALARTDAGGSTPRNALLAQGAIALLLVFLGALTRDGFKALVEYTAPVFWFFFFLVGVSLFVLRRKDPARPRPFRVPLYPLTPLIFCGVCAYMIRSSLAYTGIGALVGVAVLLLGVPVWWVARRQGEPQVVFAHKEIHP